MNGFQGLEKKDGTENLFFEKFLGRYFWKKRESVLLAEYNLNRQFAREGLVTLRDFYILLGIDNEEREYAKSYGWEISGTDEKGYGWIDFSHKLMTNEHIPYYVIDYPMSPFNIDIFNKKGVFKCLN